MSLPKADSGSIPQPGARNEEISMDDKQDPVTATQERTINMQFRLSVDMDTNQYQDLVLRQFVRQIPQWFGTLTPTQIREVLRTESDNIYMEGGYDV